MSGTNKHADGSFGNCIRALKKPDFRHAAQPGGVDRQPLLNAK